MSNRTWFPIFIVALLFELAHSLGAAAEDADLVYAEQTLREAKLAVDGPSLLKFFQQRTLSPAGRKKLAGVVRLLGSDDFQVRRKAYKELLRAGRPAIPFLKQAAKDPDPEIARSAEQLLGRIESGSDVALAMAAARVLAARKPAGAASVLLAYLPMVDDEALEESVLEALAVVGFQAGKVEPLLAAALKEEDPAKRMGAAFVHGKGGPELRKALLSLLHDPSPRVRFRAALPLVRARDKAGIAPLITLLDEGPEALAWQVEDILFRIAGTKAPQVVLGRTLPERRKCREAWAGWWKANETGVDLARLDLEKTLLGLNVVCECGAAKHPSGYVWEFGADGKVRWEFDNTNTPVDVHILPGGRVLLAEFSTNDVTERDRKGKIVWTYRANAPGRSCQRLPNGNTFIATTSALMEVTRAGKQVYSHARNVFRARKLRNGHILYVGAGQVVEMATGGKDLHKIIIPGGTGVWADADLLPSGRYLVALYTANKVIEIDRTGKVHWQVTVQTPSSVNRLPNGNTLVTSMDARLVVEFNREGKNVWKQTTPGRPFCVRRY
jgi:HEAT repeat protein